MASIPIIIHTTPSAQPDGATPDRAATSPLWSYGFRPFFLAAAALAVLAIPLWVAVLSGLLPIGFAYPPREWHVHEMLFGFLPAAMAGFLLTAIPNWTDRASVRGGELMTLAAAWAAGRAAMLMPWLPTLAVALVDSLFLLGLAAIIWRELLIGRAWGQSAVGVIVSLYALANGLFHAFAIHGGATDLPERLALALDLSLLTLIGGRLAPTFTREYVIRMRLPQRPGAFGTVDRAALALVGLASLAWIIQPESMLTGVLLLGAGVAQALRAARWQGWCTWREPLVTILHVGYLWLALSMLLMGAATLGWGIAPATALHALTAGAMGAMTLAIMTRASLGHTGRPKTADAATRAMYGLVIVGAVLRLAVPSVDAWLRGLPITLTLAALCWSGAYLVYLFVYGPYLLAPSLPDDDDE